MKIELIDIKNYPLYVQWWISLLTIEVGEKSRSLFFLQKDGYKWHLELLFIKLINPEL